ncbi:MAG TPA: hypothetical protein VK824_03040 [Planctomycetota bacterium]|nr:hypothetical protein [Planctomycetota bacterium]
MRAQSLVASGLVLALAVAGWMFLADRPEATAGQSAPAVVELESPRDAIPVAGASALLAPLSPLPPAPLADVPHAAVVPEPLVAPPLSGSAALGIVRANVVTADGHGVSDVEITLSADADLFTLPAPRTGATRGADAGHRRTLPKGLLPATFEPMLPGVPFLASVTDVLGRPLASMPCPPLAPGERRLLEVPLAASPGRLRIRLVDRSGEPVMDAEAVVVRQQRVDGISSVTIRLSPDSDGEVSLDNLAPVPVDVVVQRFGRQVLRVREVVPLADRDALVLVLDRGRRVTVRGVTAAGAPLTLERVWPEPVLSARGPPVFEPDTPDGTWTVELAPEGEVSLNVRADDRYLLVKTALDEVVVVFADRVPLTVSWGADVERAGAVQDVSVTETLRAPDQGSCSERRAVTDDERLARRLVLLMPPGACSIELADRGADGRGVPLATGAVTIEPGTQAFVELRNP